jgi:hypothetical protein
MPHLRPVRVAATVAKSSLSMSDSVFLEFAETDLLRRGSLDLADCREMVEMGDSMGREAVELLREAESCAPCPGGRRACLKGRRPGEPGRGRWSQRRGRRSRWWRAGRAAAVAGRAAAAAEEAAPMAGASPLWGRRLPRRRQRPQRPSRHRALKVERVKVLRPPPPAGTTTFQAATTAPVAESPPGNEGVEGEGVEETWVVLLAAS